LLGLCWLLHHKLDAVEAKLTLQQTQQGHARTRIGRRYRHHAVAHVLEDVVEVLAVPVHEDAAIMAHILSVPSTEGGIEERVRDAPQRLHQRLEVVAADVELDAAFLLLRVHVHSFDLAMEGVLLLGDLGLPLGALICDLGECTLEPRGTLVAMSAARALWKSARSSSSSATSSESNSILRPKVVINGGRETRYDENYIRQEAGFS
jgi:hypothetical protein